MFSKWDRYPKVGHSPNVIFSFSFAILVYVKRSPILQKVAGRDCHGTLKYWPASGPDFVFVFAYCFTNTKTQRLFPEMLFTNSQKSIITASTGVQTTLIVILYFNFLELPAVLNGGMSGALVPPFPARILCKIHCGLWRMDEFSAAIK